MEQEDRRKQVEGGAEGWRNAYFKGLLQVVSVGKDYERNLRQVKTGSNLLISTNTADVQKPAQRHCGWCV